MIELFDYYNHYNLPYPNNNGDVILQPISCTVTAQVNGTWQLKISHPLDEEGRWTHIIMNSVLRVAQRQAVLPDQAHGEDGRNNRSDRRPDLFRRRQ